MKLLYAIYNTRTELIETTYGSFTVPALYVTYGMANGILKKRQKANKGRWQHCQIREVEVTVR